MDIIHTLKLNKETLKLFNFDKVSGTFSRFYKVSEKYQINKCVEIAKVDFMNLYIPSRWYLDKKSLSDCIIKPIYSENKDCVVIPLKDIVLEKYDINNLLLSNLYLDFTKLVDFDKEIFFSKYRYEKHSEEAELLEYYVNQAYKNNERKCFTVFGYKFVDFLFSMDEGWYIGCYCTKSNQWIFLEQNKTKFVAINDSSKLKTFLSKVLNSRNAKRLFKDIENYQYAKTLHSGKRLSKFLLKLIVRNISVKREDEKFLIINRNNQRTIASLSLEGVDKKNWVITLFNEENKAVAYETLHFRKNENVSYYASILSNFGY